MSNLGENALTFLSTRCVLLGLIIVLAVVDTFIPNMILKDDAIVLHSLASMILLAETTETH